MLNIVKITEGANLAIHSLAFLAKKDAGKLSSVSEISKGLVVSKSHLAKVLQRLARHSYIKSIRGAKGGFSLAKSPAKISLFEIIEIIDGPFHKETCLLGKPICKAGSCILKPLSITIEKYLIKTKISDFKIKN